MLTPLHALVVAGAPDAAPLLDALRRAGFDPRARCVTTPEGLGTALAQRPWDAVLVRHSADGLSAWDVIGNVRRTYARLPVLVVADGLSEAEVVDLIGAGAADVLSGSQLERLGVSTAKALRQRREAASPDDADGAPMDPAFQALAEHMPIGLYRSTEDGRILYANPALARILGRDSVDELFGADVVSTLSYPRESFVERIAEDGTVRNLEACWERAGGEVVWTRENTRAVRDDDGALLYYEGTMEDITEERTALLNEQRRVEQLEAIVRFSAAVDAAQSSEALHDAIVRAVEETLQADAAVLVQREDGRFEIRAWSETISEASVRLCTEAEVWASYPAHTQPLLLRDEQAVPTDALVEPLRRFMREAGLRALGSFPLLYRGEPLGMVVTFFREPHTFTEGELRIAETLAWHVAVALSRWRAECALRSSELRYRAISELAADYAYSIRLEPGGESRFEWATKAFERISGYTPEEVADTAGLLTLIHEDDRPAVEAGLQRLLDGHTVDFEVRIRTKDGAERWVSNRSRPVAGEHGRVTHVYSSGRDVTERKRFETELIVAREQAEEMARLKSAFLANMSHEIRTPLTGILGFAGVLAEEVDDDHREFVQLIEKSGRRLLDTLNSVLDLAQLESAGVRVDAGPLDVVDEVRQVVCLLGPLAEEKGIALDLDAAPGEVVAPLDATCLNRILHNLVGNAIKFTERGGVRVAVGVEGGRVRITVADTGIGIDGGFLPHLFDEFKQESTGQGRSHEGSGLGLAITKKLVDLMGGEIRVESEKGAGSTFVLDFARTVPPPSSGDGQAGAAPPALADAESPADQETGDPFLDVFAERADTEETGMEEGEQEEGGSYAPLRDVVSQDGSLAPEEESLAFEPVDPDAFMLEPVELVGDPHDDISEAAPDDGVVADGEPEDEEVNPSDTWAYMPDTADLEPLNPGIDDAALEAEPDGAESLSGDAGEVSDDWGWTLDAEDAEPLDPPRESPEASSRLEWDEPTLSAMPLGDGARLSDADDFEPFSADELAEPAFVEGEKGEAEPHRERPQEPAGDAPREVVLIVEDNDETRLLIERVLAGHYEVETAADARTALQRMAARTYDALILDINLGGRSTGVDVLRVARALPGYDAVTAIALTAYALPGDGARFLAEGFDHYVSKPFSKSRLLDVLAAGRTENAAGS